MRNKKKKNVQEGYYFKFYGLPIEVPNDRHRWLLTVKDIEVFFENLVKKKNLNLNFFSHKKKSIKFKILKFFLGERITKELTLPFVWIMLEKK